jgi:hypothetical protein
VGDATSRVQLISAVMLLYGVCVSQFQTVGQQQCNIYNGWGLLLLTTDGEAASTAACWARETARARAVSGDRACATVRVSAGTQPYFDYSIKTGIFGQPEAKVHLGQAWRIDFSYRNIHEY